ncbi:hypothetical protein GCM10009430_32340 [Aquimarina litoralis]|uniref:Uncharacterized protein n=1 Tax=Aquimarina litoralis TaxID=584605 RepID=A0ABP3UCL7_9FLAO
MDSKNYIRAAYLKPGQEYKMEKLPSKKLTVDVSYGTQYYEKESETGCIGQFKKTFVIEEELKQVDYDINTNKIVGYDLHFEGESLANIAANNDTEKSQGIVYPKTQKCISLTDNDSIQECVNKEINALLFSLIDKEILNKIINDNQINEMYSNYNLTVDSNGRAYIANNLRSSLPELEAELKNIDVTNLKLPDMIPAQLKNGMSTDYQMTLKLVFKEM